MSTHSNIVTLIRNIATAVNVDGRFIYGDDIFQTVDYPNQSEASSEQNKALISLLPFTLTISNNDDMNYNNATLNMLFTRSSDVDSTALEQEDIVDSMMSLAELFIAVLDAQAKPVSYLIGDIQLEGQRNIYMGTVSGVIASFRIDIRKDCDLPAYEGLQTVLQSILQG